MPHLNLILLGPPRLERDGVPLKLDTKKTFALFTYLSLTHQTHRRDSLVNLLWPHSDQTKARGHLRGCLYNLHKVLGDGWLHSDRETVALKPDADLWVDVDAFRSLLAGCKGHGHPGDGVCPYCLKPLGEAAELYRGDFLGGFNLKDSAVFDDWQSAWGQSLRSDLDLVFERLIGCLREEGDTEKAIAYARRWLELEAVNEEAHRQLIDLYARTGQTTAAFRQYEECVRVLEEELAASPHEDTIRLYQEIKENAFSAKTAFSIKGQKTEIDKPDSHKPTSAPRHNLPRQLTNFIGRDREMRAIKDLLSRSSLLTLKGAGGCGKTRLALQVATGMVDEYEDGVWFVGLASLSEAALVTQEVASALGVHEQPGRPLVDILSDYLKSKHMLLILDNCEHLIEACAGMADTLLHNCENLKIMATSRESLNLEGETTCYVPSLSFPDSGSLEVLKVSDLMQFESLHLFQDRTVSLHPTFTLTEGNTSTVAYICYRLDGIPLAIELAAAWVNALSLEQILGRLDNCFNLLTKGYRTALPRHQTLRATMDWSYDLLDEKEKILLWRLSVFMGGWTLEAAEAICAGEGIEDYEVLDTLMGLVDKSLVTTEEQGKEARYYFLETVRQYGRDKLMESGEGGVLCERHLEWYLDLAEQAEPELGGLDQVMWLERLEVEHDNLRAALEWSLGSGGEPSVPGGKAGSPRAEAGLRLAGALRPFWWIRGYFNEGREWLERALAQGSAVSASVRARTLSAAGGVAWGHGDYERAISLNEESLSLYREVGDKSGIAGSLTSLGLVEAFQGHHERAMRLYEESLSMCREAGDKKRIASLLCFMGGMTFYQGDYERAEALSRESITLCREVGDKRMIAYSLIVLGFVMRQQGDYERAQALSQEGLALHYEMGNKRGIAYGLAKLAQVTVALEQPERTARLFGAEEVLRQTMGTPVYPYERDEYDRSLAAVRAELGEEAFEAAWAEGRKMTIEQAIDYALKIDDA